MDPSQSPTSPNGARSRYLLALGSSTAISLASIVVAGPSGDLSRDEAIYAYGGQQLADGIPPYVSIFDPKGPFAFVLAALGTVAARIAGVSDLSGIRLVFALAAVVAAAGVFCLTHRVSGSLAGGVVAAASFATYEGWIRDAFSGPDAKTPMVAFLVWGLFLICRRNWALAGAAVVLAASTWQPAVLPLAASLGLGAATLQPRGTRWRSAGRAAVGAGLVVVAYLVWLTLSRALDDAVEAALVFPLTGVKHVESSVLERLDGLFHVADCYYGVGGPVLLVATGVLAVLIVRSALRLRRGRRGHRGRRDDDLALVAVIAPAFVITAGYTLSDFQGYPDAFPLLPFASLGLGGAAAAVVGAARTPLLARVGSIAVATVTIGGLVAAAVGYTEAPDDLRAGQTSWACALTDVAPASGDLWALGDPTPLVLTGLTNPDRYVYLASGVSKWKTDRLDGGMEQWQDDVLEQAPRVVMIKGIDQRGVVATTFKDTLRANGYVRRFLGDWAVFVPVEIAESRPAQLTDESTTLARDRAGSPIRGC